jgi:hypothetical protein
MNLHRWQLIESPWTHCCTPLHFGKNCQLSPQINAKWRVSLARPVQVSSFLISLLSIFIIFLSCSFSLSTFIYRFVIFPSLFLAFSLNLLSIVSFHGSFTLFLLWCILYFNFFFRPFSYFSAYLSSHFKFSSFLSYLVLQCTKIQEYHFRFREKKPHRKMRAT